MWEVPYKTFPGQENCIESEGLTCSPAASPGFLHLAGLRAGWNSGTSGCQTLKHFYWAYLSITESHRNKKRKKEIAFSNGTVQFVQNCAVPIRQFSLLTLCLCMQLPVFQNSSLNEIGKLQKRLSWKIQQEYRMRTGDWSLSGYPTVQWNSQAGSSLYQNGFDSEEFYSS